MQNTSQKRAMTTQTLAYCALLAALSVVLARLFGLMPSESSRFSIEAVPVFMAGMFFGPVAGGMVGFTADFVGCLFSPYGFNPIFSVPPILYGVFAGLFRHYLAKNTSIVSLLLAWLPPVVLGSIAYQSVTLTYMYYSGAFFEGLLVNLSSRSVQFAITMALDVVITYSLMRSGIFTRLGVWPPVSRK